MKGTVHKTILDLDNTGWVVKEAVFGFERSQNIPGKIFTSLSPPLLQSSEKGEFVSISGSHRLHSTRWSAVTAHRGWTASFDDVQSNQAHSTVRPLPFTGERPMRKLYILNIHYISRALRITWSFRAKSDSRPEGEVSLQEAERDARNNGGEWKPLKTHRITCLSGFIVQLKEGEVNIICFTFVVRVSCCF